MVTRGKETPTDVHWTDRYDGREGCCFFGHAVQLNSAIPLRAPHAMGLDTGCAYGGVLTAAVVAAGTDPRDAEIVAVPGKAYSTLRGQCRERISVTGD